MGAGKGRNRDAAPNPDELAAVQRIVELRATGMSYRDIAAALDAEGIPPRRAASWSSMAVRSIALRELASRVLSTAHPATGKRDDAAVTLLYRAVPPY